MGRRIDVRDWRREFSSIKSSALLQQYMSYMSFLIRGYRRAYVELRTSE